MLAIAARARFREMRPDPAIDALRRQGAAARKLELGGQLDLGLYGLSQPARKASP